jgi:hypothetical protein
VTARLRGLLATAALAALAAAALAAVDLAVLRWAGIPPALARAAAALGGALAAAVVLAGRLLGRERCACGRPLHYADPATERAVRRLVDQLGERTQVTTTDGSTFLVPRHYIALHGLAADQLPRLGFPEVDP